MIKKFLWISLLLFFTYSGTVSAVKTMDECITKWDTQVNFAHCSNDYIPLIIQYTKDHPVNTIQIWGINDLGIIAFARNLGPNVTKIWVEDSPITDMGLKALLQNPYFQGIYIKNVKVTGKNGGFDPLRKKTTLRHFQLFNTDLSDADFSPMSQTQFDWLSLNYNKITDKGAAQIARVNARVLDLGNNEIGKEGATALSRNVFFEKLYLNNNKLDDAAAIEFSKNTTIHILSLEDNNISDIGALSFLNNISLKCLILSDKFISEEIQKKLINESKFKVSFWGDYSCYW